MKIGAYQIDTLNTGYFALDGGAMFGVVPKKLWQREHPADTENRIRMALRTLLLRSDDRVILVDTGIGEKFPEKYRQIYAIEQSGPSLNSELAKHGLSPDDVSDVILTHLHFDHAGGATVIDNGTLKPAFKNANYWIQQRNLDWAMAPSEKDRASYLPENFQPLQEAGILKTLAGPAEIFPGISAWLSDGHTIGQQLIKIADDSQTLIYCADIIPMVSHLKLPYIMGYDLQPLVTLEEKRQILTQAAEQGWILVFEHDPEIAAATIQASDKGFMVKESLKL